MKSFLKWLVCVTGASLIAGCGMLGDPLAWSTVGEGIVKACARCHASDGTIKLKSPAPPGAGPAGPSGHASCPVECPANAGR